MPKTGITNINLRNNSIDAAGAEALAAVLPQIQAFIKGGGVLQVNSKDKLVIHCDFSIITTDERPDLELQQLMLQGLQDWVSFGNKQAEEITLLGCAALTANHLLPFLHEGLVHLDLRGSAIETIPPAIQNCSLKALYLAGCSQIQHLATPQGKTFGKLSLPYLELLDTSLCNNLEEIHLESPRLQTCIAENNPKLSTINFSSNLKTRISLEGSPHLDFKKLIKDQFPSFFQTSLSKEFCEGIGLYFFHLIHEGGEKGERFLFGGAFLDLLQEKTGKQWAFVEGYDLSRFVWKSSDFAEELKALVPLLQHTKITQLDLRGNKINDAQAKVLVAALSKTEITHLDLESNLIGDEGVEALSTLLSKTKITQLNLRDNPIKDSDLLVATLPQVKAFFVAGRILNTNGNEKLTVQCFFNTIFLDGKPDLQRHRQILCGLQDWLYYNKKQAEEVTLIGCAVLTASDLLSFSTKISPSSTSADQ